MAEFDEEDELTRFKRWWANNGRGLILGVVLGLLIVGGWYTWNWYQDRQARYAASLYGKVTQALDKQKMTAGAKQAIKDLKNDYGATPYATAAAMALGRFEVSQGNSNKAKEQFAWAVKNAPNAGMRSLARTRQVRMVWNEGKADKALKLLRSSEPAPGFASLYAEIRGDILVAKHQRSDAHAAYKKALAERSHHVPKRRLQAKVRSTSPADNESTSSSNP
ncbi:tetratricopeptide repeat protein [Salinisphaera sp. USBA-960]|uniref:YfgM family protein n=1 Tax=Salinisphaera orenii TaxID=856731 RepID=UPI000DBE204C|nr:tetratricopeptide repeat protein [Salifodinibacter halophilus]NNC25776.1 tetratricopeptide repeat protein [Salifodinibacter halophilus]